MAGACLAFWKPATAIWFRPQWIPLFLGIIMLSMGLSLNFTDFKRLLEIPRSIFLGVSLQYTIMPLLGYFLAHIMDLPTDYIIGFVLVACCPSGTASNVVCFIARTHVALSVSLTTCSTLLAVLMTPLLTTLLMASISSNLLEAKVKVDTLGLLINTLKVVVFPVFFGLFLNHYFHNWVKRINSYTPLLAVLSIVFIVDYILAVKKDSILAIGSSLLGAVVALHSLGFLLGYILSKLFGYAEMEARTVSIEVGMQNSGLATELARSNFPGFESATVPGAISALTHCILGSIASGFFRIFRYKQGIKKEIL